MSTPALHSINIRIDRSGRSLMFDYEPGSEQALFDICDPSGHILQTGEVRGPATHVRIPPHSEDDLILMILDGEVSTVRPIRFEQAA